ncbi:sterol desaturase family protein [Mesorhizobium sp. M0615]|uniref:sterol desaturase family protein n=1 Tax=unclassified Mesorhizobium TaxID=325217 RepID=UPI0003CF066B|nr:MULTISPECIES: sterol desaturase family protein [unclassified Mesorhizobium]ESY13605.1 fatty acid hydroxylase [Mesorhizobium sp. LNJC398B00]ESY38366.1 fatty acid hydroxylase [Mesorhizobium sp. LNJC386A00]
MFSEFARVIVEKLSHIDLLTLGLLLLTALGSAVVAYWRTVEQKSFRDFFDFAFPAEVIMHPSARADALFWITKRLVMPFLLIPAGVTFVAATGYATNQAVGWLFSISQPLIPGPAGPVTIILFTATMLVAYDISYYLYHVAQHRFPFLWELHKVHHSAEVMVGITKDRVHPLDDLMNRIWDGVIPGISFGLWSLIALNPVEIAIFGINVYVIRNILMMDFVRHTHLKISFGRLNGVILCPHWHQVHHSVDPRHYDKNFGLLFSFWDRIFGTQFIPDPDEDLKFGLIDRDVRDYQSLFGLYVLPLRKMANHIVRLFQKRIDVARPQDRLQP